MYIVRSLYVVKHYTEADSNAFVDLADLLRYHSKYIDAEDLYLLGLGGVYTLEEGSSPRTVNIGLKLARLFRHQSWFDRAIPLLRRAVTDTGGGVAKLRIAQAQTALRYTIVPDRGVRRSRDIVPPRHSIVRRALRTRRKGLTGKAQCFARKDAMRLKVYMS